MISGRAITAPSSRLQRSGAVPAPLRPSRRRRCRSLLLLAPAAAAALAGEGGAAEGAATTATTTTTTTTPATTTTTPTYTRATLRTTDACELAVSVYPFFRYKAAGGGGQATVAAAAADAQAPSSSSSSSPSSPPPPPQQQQPKLLQLTFDPAQLRIPALDYRTAYLFGVVPIPPPLRIAIEPLELRGTLDAATGEARLTFDAQFCFSAGALYRAPPLRVQTVLTTGRSEGARLSGEGRRWAGAESGGGGGGGSSNRTSVRLAGVARVPKTGDAFLDAFLMLPNDALAVLEGEIELM